MRYWLRILPVGGGQEVLEGKVRELVAEGVEGLGAIAWRAVAVEVDATGSEEESGNGSCQNRCKKRRVIKALISKRSSTGHNRKEWSRKRTEGRTRLALQRLGAAQ